VPGIPDEIAQYAGVAKYLISRLPTAQVLTQWTNLRPPDDLKTPHAKFADSMEQVIEAHHAFNEASFGRSGKSVNATREDLRVAMEAHKQLQQEFDQQLDQFLQTGFDVSLDMVPEIQVSIEP